MLAIEIVFTAGRYHATPWGRNVNEGVVEWPPSPYRLARALVDVCRRRHPDWEDARLEQILRVVQSAPNYYLPPATSSHTRSYLSSNDKDASSKQKVFDAFVCINKNAGLYIGFDLSPNEDVIRDLGELLSELDYLGRSESWIRARLVNATDITGFNCRPTKAGAIGKNDEMIQVACLRHETDYSNLPMVPIIKRGKKEVQLSWLEAISLSTKDLLQQGWSAPPAQVTVDYVRSSHSLKPLPAIRRRTLSSGFNTARYNLDSAVLPRVTETVPVAERIRAHLMGIHKKVIGSPDSVSPLFSGKSPDGGPATGHEHIFIWPMDTNGDGRIDQIVVKSALPFEASELDAMDRLRSVWQPDGRPDVELVLVSLAKSLKGTSSKHWVSATPFVTNRHHRKGRGSYQEWLEEEIRRECAIHCLPEPERIEFIDHCRTAGHALRWMEFVRSRKGSAPIQGHGCRMTFADDIEGPFALGSLCHFGLGLFVPESQ